MTFSRRFGYEADHFENFPDRFAVAFQRELEAFFAALVAGETPTPARRMARFGVSRSFLTWRHC